MEAPSKVFLLFFLFSDWLKSDQTWFFEHFLRHICSAVTETIRVTNFATSFGARNIQKTKFEAAEMILDPWNQRCGNLIIRESVIWGERPGSFIM